MKRLLYLLTLIAPLSLLNFHSFGQCDVNTGCAGAPILTIDAPVFDAASSSIVLNNITFGEFECTAATYQSGIVVYIYQLLPNGDRMELCNVVNAAPYNVVGSVAFGFGQTSFCGMGTTNVGTLDIGPDQGFEACDGAFLEVEAVLFITDNMGFNPSTGSVYNNLNANEYISVALGNVELNINNEFPGGGQPLTTAIINEFDTGSDGPLTVNCGEDVDLYVEGLSRLANCTAYSYLGTGISSELSNVLSYTVNGGAPVIVLDPSTGAFGGQLTGPDPALGGLCYAGVFTIKDHPDGVTPDDPYTLEWADLPQDLCAGSTVVVTITTTDIFTGVTLSDDITINYTGAACNDCGIPGCLDPCDPNYDMTATINDPALCAGYDDTCNADCTMGPFGGIWDAATCSCINETTPVLGCTDVAFCEYNPAADCDDGSCLTSNIDPGTCDDGDCTNGVETWDAATCVCIDNTPTDVLGCTDANFCEYDPNATCDDGSCVTSNVDPGTCSDNDCTNGLETWDAATCACVNNPPSGVNGCTDAAFCEYDPAADCDDGSCANALPTAATIAGGPFDFCAGDGTPDFVSGITVNGGSGTNAAWVVTDDQLNILGLPGMPGDVDFDGAGLGTCLIWYVTFEDIAGAEVGMNAANLTGCFALSNSIEVVREDCTDPCAATAATIAGGPFSFCVADGTPDFVSDITIAGGSGANSAWVITDDQLNILGLPGMPGDVDFDGAGFGNCLIWYVTFDDIMGAEVGMNAANLTGCFALSNSIEVVREDCGPCEEEITGGITVPDAGCDITGVTISVIAPDGTIINVTTGADGSFSVPGGPFPCGDYMAAFFDLSELPACYLETGSTDPISFTLDGDETGELDFEFVANPAVPTLSQWSLIVLTLLLMSLGAIQLYASVNRLAFKQRF